MSNLNYKHLHYFWVVAHEGSMTRAAERLGVAVQTISGQLSLLERNLGKALFVLDRPKEALPPFCWHLPIPSACMDLFSTRPHRSW